MAVSLCYVFAKDPVHGKSFWTWGRRLSPFVGIIGLALFVFTVTWHFYALGHQVPTFAYLDPLFPYFNWLNETVIALAYSSIMFALLFGYQVMKRPFEFKPLCLISVISYGLYMWHLPLLDFFQKSILPLLPHPGKYRLYGLYWGWVALVVVPIAVLSYRFIEKQGMQWAH